MAKMANHNRDRSQKQRDQEIEKRLVSYIMTASAAGVGVLALTVPAGAEVVYAPADIKIHSRTDFRLDLNGDGITDFALSNGTDFGHEGGQGAVPAVHGNAVLGYPGSRQMFASALQGHVKIGPGGNFVHQPVVMATWFVSSGQLSSRGPWKDAINRYLGLAFLIDGETHYGWARISVKGENLLLTGYAYETVPNTPILTGQTSGNQETGDLANPSVTQPSQTLGLLALGSSGIEAWRTTNR